ncbi:unnamed protein product [Closterium sp. NIES-54]
MRAIQFRRAQNFACTRCELAGEHMPSPQRVAKLSSVPRGAPKFRMALACPSGQVARVIGTLRAVGTGGLPSHEGYFPSCEGSPARRPHPVMWGAVNYVGGLWGGGRALSPALGHAGGPARASVARLVGPDSDDPSRRHWQIGSDNRIALGCSA